MIHKLNPNLLAPSEILFDEDFLDEALAIFPNTLGDASKTGGVGKYLYGSENWENLIHQGNAVNSNHYYPCSAEEQLLKLVASEISDFITEPRISYIDFGVGSKSSFNNKVMPIINRLNSTAYTAVDFSQPALVKVESIAAALLPDKLVRSQKLDFFFPTNKVISQNQPAFGAVNGLTISNIPNYGMQNDITYNLVCALKYLSQLCGHGWLLITIDTNTDQNLLKQAYCSVDVAQLILSLFHRISRELPTEGFDPALFDYAPEFILEQQLWAHKAVATESQTFQLGPYEVNIEAGQKLHINNSYKWSKEFFEACSRDADLSVVKNWEHETGIVIYLLKDNQLS